MTAAYQRILLKLSGEALMGDDAYGINRDVVSRIVGEIADVSRLGVQGDPGGGGLAGGQRGDSGHGGDSYSGL